MFLIRKDRGIVFVGDDKKALHQKIESAKSVTLKTKNNISVLIDNLDFDRFQSNSVIAGTIHGFEPPMEQHNGLKIGDRVEFSEQKIFSCAV